MCSGCFGDYEDQNEDENDNDNVRLERQRPYEDRDVKGMESSGLRETTFEEGFEVFVGEQCIVEIYRSDVSWQRSKDLIKRDRRDGVWSAGHRYERSGKMIAKDYRTRELLKDRREMPTEARHKGPITIIAAAILMGLSAAWLLLS